MPPPFGADLMERISTISSIKRSSLLEKPHLECKLHVIRSAWSTKAFTIKFIPTNPIISRQPKISYLINKLLKWSACEEAPRGFRTSTTCIYNNHIRYTKRNLKLNLKYSLETNAWSQQRAASLQGMTAQKNKKDLNLAERTSAIRTHSSQRAILGK